MADTSTDDFRGESAASSAAPSPVDSFDAYAPSRIAERVGQAGVAKSRLGLTQLFTLAVLAGAFIALGAVFFLSVTFQFGPGPGPGKLVGSLCFSMGLVLVVVGGAELFTGNNLIVMARCDGLIGTGAVLRNWSAVYAGNFVGAAATAVLVAASGILGPESGDFAAHARRIAAAKMALPADEAFVRGLLCNVLVCLAVWLAYAGHSVTDKILAVVFPITAFVALGFEHSVANMFFLPLGFLAGQEADVTGFFRNLACVTAGNVVGGGVFVAAIYWLVYRRCRPGL